MGDYIDLKKTKQLLVCITIFISIVNSIVFRLKGQLSLKNLSGPAIIVSLAFLVMTARSNNNIGNKIGLVALFAFLYLSLILLTINIFLTPIKLQFILFTPTFFIFLYCYLLIKKNMKE